MNTLYLIFFFFFIGASSFFNVRERFNAVRKQRHDRQRPKSYVMATSSSSLLSASDSSIASQARNADARYDYLPQSICHKIKMIL